MTSDETRTCPGNDPGCPCPDGLMCHYEGPDAWPIPETRPDRDALRERFYAKTRRDTETGCLLWTGARGGGGLLYGAFKWLGKRKQVGAHRAAWLLAGRSIPDGWQIDHLCRTTLCVEITHLEAVTPGVNVLRGNTVVAVNAARTECPQGHPYDEANTYVDKKGRRSCRRCGRDRSAAARAARAGGSDE